MRSITVHIPEHQSLTVQTRLLEYIKKAVLKTGDMEIPVNLSTVPVSNGVSVIFFDFNVSPLRALAVASAVKVATYLAFGTKVELKKIQVTMHTTLSA